jgi:Spy/CpxP family protein refolding chaperone
MNPLTFLLLFLSSVAVWAAITALRAAKSGWAGSHSRRLNTLQALFDEHSDQIGTLTEQLRTLRARVGMRELREKRQTAQELPAEPTSDDEKARVRRELGAKLANGELKPIGR